MREKGYVGTLILLTLLLVIIGGSGYYLGVSQNKQYLSKKPDTTSDILPSISPKQSIFTSPSETPIVSTNQENLEVGKFYVNSSMGFSLSYPLDITPSEKNNDVVFGNLFHVYLVKGHDRYWGCAIPTNRCPVGQSQFINGTEVLKNTGTNNSIGGKDLLEYDFAGFDPKDDIRSDKTELHLFFDYTGGSQDSNNINLFNKIIRSVKYIYGDLPGPRG
ncbi:hypothetical protein M1563_04110 [Patescibacteria group bacterium]|nr:hypothetical protein [Patescibacteria group bacterium]